MSVKHDLPDHPSLWMEVWQEYYAERAAMREHEGRQGREYAEFHAEVEARLEFRKAQRRQGFVDELKRIAAERKEAERK